MPVWHCEDCHQVGFYFNKTEREAAEEHAKTCEATKAALAREDDPNTGEMIYEGEK